MLLADRLHSICSCLLWTWPLLTGEGMSWSDSHLFGRS